MHNNRSHRFILFISQFISVDNFLCEKCEFCSQKKQIDNSMPSEMKFTPALPKQGEKPDHYIYLKDFRVEQCPSFIQHKCTNHRPFTCFHWHFSNQRRRRCIRKRDGSFNYSPDKYCTQYNETTGICPNGDQCIYLHRTNGDTERKFHLRYFKTSLCLNETDSRGHCIKNGEHCAYSHAMTDFRKPVMDINEWQFIFSSDIKLDAQTILEKEHSFFNDDLKWQDTNYVLLNYKTEPCRRLPRYCRQGFACPQYHNLKDKRRCFRKFSYKSTACPNVRNGEDWGEPSNCELGDNCSYCHTRTEQQFHPEIYKSTKCNDILKNKFCPRGIFCAFAHIEEQITSDPENETIVLIDLSNDYNGLGKFTAIDNTNATYSESSGSIESLGSSPLSSLSSDNKAPGAHLNRKKCPREQTSPTQMAFDLTKQFSDSLIQNVYFKSKNGLYGIDSSSNQNNSYFDKSFETAKSVIGNTLEDLSLNNQLSIGSNSDQINVTLDNPISNSLRNNILNNNILSPKSNNQYFCSSFLNGLQQGSPTMNNYGKMLLGNDFPFQQLSPPNFSNGFNDEVEDLKRKLKSTEQQRDEAYQKLNSLQISDFNYANNNLQLPNGIVDLKYLSLPVLKSIQSKLKTDLELTEKSIYLESNIKCLICKKENRSVTLTCNHFVFCNQCALIQTECPYCRNPINKQ